MLRNKYFIIVLVVMLLLVMNYNLAFFKSRFGKKELGTVAQTPAVAVMQFQKGPVLPQVMLTSRPVDEWRRDPFWYPESTKLAAPISHATASHPSSGFQLELEATMMRDGRGYAIISGQVVGVGERVGEYFVVEIGDLFVKLSGPGGIKKLSITTDTSVKE